MKKSLFTLLVVMLFGTAAIAQTPTTHHFAQNVYEDLNGTMFGELFIDGELQTGYNWEIGVFDENTWEENNTNLETGNPLDFPEYDIKIKKGVLKSGLKDSVVTGHGKVRGHLVSCAISDFNFMGGSMGSVAGEKIVRTIEYGIENKLPVIIFTASGGARMQEAILS